MIRLFVPQDLTHEATFALALEQGRYLTTVMRRTAGDQFAAFNGRDGEWRCELVEVGKKVVVVRPVELVLPQGPAPTLELLIAVIKRGPLETVVEKATELGAARIQLIVTERTQGDRVRLDRLTAIAIESAEQTGRLDVPAVLAPVNLEHWLAQNGNRRVMMCDETGDAHPVSQALADATPADWSLLIGPEGGFSSEERAGLRADPRVTPVSLGPRILRADTAAISALTLWQSTIGDWTAP